MEKVFEFFNNDDYRVDVCKKYLLFNDGKFIEDDPSQILRRVAKALSSVNESPSEAETTYYEAMDNFRRVVPQGSVLAGAGNDYQLMSLSNCFVIDSPSDSILGIYLSQLQEAQIMKRRGGVGIDLSKLRPKDSLVNNAAKSSSGAAGWADAFSNTCRAIGQGGRRGALMLTLDIDHPDAEEWCLMKQDLTAVTGANVSLKITDKFMKAVEEKGEFIQRFRTDDGEVLMERTIKASELWDVIIKCAHATAEPGLLMWDNITKTLPLHCYPQFKTISTNPCAEIPLSANDSCRLISICLAFYVENAFTSEAYFNFDKFKKDIRTAVKMSDDLVELELRHVMKIMEREHSDVEKELWQKIYDAGHDGRRTGLGTHGLADCLIYLGVRYDSEKALDVLESIYSTLCHTAYDESCNLGQERGNFPAFDWELEKNCEFYKTFPPELMEKMAKGRRNGAILTMAPTGSISTLSGVSSGIEPLFMLWYTRRRKINQTDLNARVDFIDAVGDKWQNYPVLSYSLNRYMTHFGVSQEDIINGSHKLPDYFVTSGEIDPFQRVKLQGVIQKYIDHGISSTINLPETVSVETVAQIYMESWKHGLKGVTIYRDKCRSGVLVSNENKSEVDEFGRPMKINRTDAPKRPKELSCDIHHITAMKIPWVVLVGKLGDEPYEVFAGKAEAFQVPGKYNSGKIVKHYKSYLLHFNGENDTDPLKVDIKKVFENPEEEDLTRMVSLSLRHGAPIEYIVDQLDKVGGATISSFTRALMRVLKKYIKVREDGSIGLKCKDCGSSSLIMEEGCQRCTQCGSSKCG